MARPSLALTVAQPFRRVPDVLSLYSRGIAGRRSFEAPPGDIGQQLQKIRMVPVAGLELATYRLQGGCSTN